MENFSFNPTINLPEPGIWLMAVTSFEATNSVFNITSENNRFSNTICGHWNSKSAGKRFDELIKLSELGSQNNIELHVKEVWKNGDKLKIGEKENELSELDFRKTDIIEDLQKVNTAFSNMRYRESN